MLYSAHEMEKGMRRLPWIALFVALLLTGCTSTRPVQGPVDAPTIPTPGQLNRIGRYWDLGLSVKYPDNWVVPQFIVGQIILAPTLEAARGQTPTQPVVAIRIVDPVKDLRLSKSATLDQIAAAISAGQNVRIGSSGATTIAGLDAAYLDLTDDNAKLNGQAIAFQMPDGRVGVMIGVAPIGVWADFAPTFDQMRGATALLKPADFGAPDSNGPTAIFPPGGISFTYPKGWIDHDLGGNTRLYRDSAAVEYLDDSGYVNGPQLVVISQALPRDMPLQTALARVVRIAPEDKVTQVMVGGQAGIQFSYTDRVSGQVLTYVSFASQDRTVMIVLRWTTPGILKDALRPTLDTILQSVRYGAVAATLVPMSGASGQTPVATVQSP
jgi:hypothetical protein